MHFGIQRLRISRVQITNNPIKVSMFAYFIISQFERWKLIELLKKSGIELYTKKKKTVHMKRIKKSEILS